MSQRIKFYRCEQNPTGITSRFITGMSKSKAAVLSDCRPVPRGDRHEHHHNDYEVVDQAEQSEHELGQDVELGEEVDDDNLRFHAYMQCSSDKLPKLLPKTLFLTSLTA